MRKSNRRPILAACSFVAMMVAAAASASAQSPWYTSFAPNPTSALPNASFSTNYLCINGSQSQGCGNSFQEVAAPFSGGGAANGGFSLTLALGSCDASTNSSVVVSLAAQATPPPGQVLETWTVTSLQPGQQPPLTTLIDQLGLSLQAGTIYYLIVQPATGGSCAQWYTNLLNQSGYANLPVIANSGLIWNPLSTIFPTQPAFLLAPYHSGSLAHIAAGAGWTTVITFVNDSNSSVLMAANLLGDDGSALTLSGSQTLGAGTSQTFQGSQLNQNLTPRTTWQITLGGQDGATQVGWIQTYITGSGPVTGYAIFRQNPQSGPASEGTVALETQSPSRLALPFDNSAGFVTGVALANLSPVTQSVSVGFGNASGGQIASGSISLPPYGHTSFAVSSMFPATSGVVGVMEIGGTGAVSAIGLRFSPYGTFTSVPATVLAPFSR